MCVFFAQRQVRDGPINDDFTDHLHVDFHILVILFIYFFYIFFFILIIKGIVVQVSFLHITQTELDPETLLRRVSEDTDTY